MATLVDVNNAITALANATTARIAADTVLLDKFNLVNADVAAEQSSLDAATAVYQAAREAANVVHDFETARSDQATAAQVELEARESLKTVMLEYVSSN